MMVRRMYAVPKTVFVTPAQREAAKLLVQRSRLTGRQLSRGVLSIAKAEIRPARAEAPGEAGFSRRSAEAGIPDPSSQQSTSASGRHHKEAQPFSKASSHQEPSESHASVDHLRAVTEMSFGKPTADKGFGLWTHVIVAGAKYLRLPLHSRWLGETDDLVIALREQLTVAEPGDTVAVSEKVVELLTGRTIEISSMQPGRLARFLAAHSKGLAVPEMMEYVVRTVGVRRIIPAAIGSAVTRPLRMQGTFYRLAGSVAQDVDGGQPPYEHVLFPPLDTKVAQKICDDLERALDIGVSIVELKDSGSLIRAVSPRSLAAETLAAVLSDNPMGERFTSTPFVLVRPVSTLPRSESFVGEAPLRLWRP
jgi:hypothetical protein